MAIKPDSETVFIIITLCAATGLFSGIVWALITFTGVIWSMVSWWVPLIGIGVACVSAVVFYWLLKG